MIRLNDLPSEPRILSKYRSADTEGNNFDGKLIRCRAAGCEDRAERKRLVSIYRFGEVGEAGTHSSLLIAMKGNICHERSSHRDAPETKAKNPKPNMLSQTRSLSVLLSLTVSLSIVHFTNAQQQPLA